MWKLLTPITTVKIGRALWMTLIPHEFITPNGKKVVPAGFLFDFASVPGLFTNIVHPVKSCLGDASLPHDFFYAKDGEKVPRKFADEGLKGITLSTAKMSDKTDKKTAVLAYYAVRIGAKNLYNKEYNFKKIKNAYKPFREMGIDVLKNKFVISYDVLDNFNFKEK